MKEGEERVKPKGGRPAKDLKRSQLLGVKCTKLERLTIQIKAKSVRMSISEYLRAMGLNGKIDMRKKSLPKEVLALTATLNHMAANLNQVAKKRNSLDELNALERAELQFLSGQFKQLAKDIKNYLQ